MLKRGFSQNMICCPILFILLKERDTSYLIGGKLCLFRGNFKYCPFILYIPSTFQIHLNLSVTCYTLLVTCHLSFVTYHQLFLICNWSLVTCHLSPVICSYVFCDPSSVICHPSLSSSSSAYSSLFQLFQPISSYSSLLRGEGV